ncbi:MAG: MoxR family ATPase [Desulfurococcales archaeon]|nr:MoxR family ATPase [Desulfurococcales archaeon]
MFLRELAAPFVGREEEAKVVVLTLLAREHAVFLGEPGVAKSAIVRRAAELLNAKFFKYLLTRFTEPAELFGPLDISALKEGRYVRIVEGKLPDAEIAFLDEVFKANSAILNALNSILQERVLYDGYSEISVPLWSLFGASNEVPEDPEVEALYDRFAVRHFVRPVPDDLWVDLLRASWELERRVYFQGGFGGRKALDIQDLRKYHERVLNVDLTPVMGKITKVFAILENRGLHITDRRKGKLLKFVAANAVLEGRDVASEQDLLTMKYVVPKDWDELEKVETVLSEELKTSYKYRRELEEIRTNVKEIMNYVLSLRGIESKYIDSRFRLISRDLQTTRDRVSSIAAECSDEKVKKLADEIIQLIDKTLDIIKGRS